MTMTPEESAQLLDAAAAGELDLNADFGSDDAPEASEQAEQPSSDPQPERTSEPAAPETEPEGAPIASKSGAYTIPFSKLADARAERDAAKAEAESLKAQIDQLTAQQAANVGQAEARAQQRADAGAAPTQADRNLEAAHAALADGIDPAIFGDFTEPDLARGIATLQARSEEQLFERVMARVNETLAPVKQKEQQAESNAHYAAIFAAHPDATEVADSAEFSRWKDALPTFMRSGVDQALAGGTAQQVVEVFSTFKTQTGARQAAPEAPAARPPVQRRSAPTSLSEMAGAAPQDTAARLLEVATNPVALLDSMDGMTSKQIDELLNRAL